MALIYRAHFAFSKNPRINSKGINTGAVYGFANSVFEILEKQKPTHIGIAFDTHGPTFRHESFEAYKANREEQPEDISTAIPYIYRLVEALNIPALVLPGYEADDIIGTIAKQAAKDPDLEVFMMTPDKDYAQLVDKNIFLYKPAMFGNGVEILGIEEVKAKFEIDHPAQVIDLLGMQGDSVDNIPGIPGVGAKTAVKFLKEYGSLEGLLENTHQLKGKQKENVETYREQAILSKQLATIHTETPIEWSLESLEMAPFDDDKLKPLLEELEFRTYLKKLYPSAAPALAETPTKRKSKAAAGQMDMFGGGSTDEDASEQPAPAEILPTNFRNIHSTLHDYQLIDTPEWRKRLLDRLSQLPAFCFDTETDNLDALEAQLVGIAFAWYPHEGYYVPFPADRTAAQALLEEFREVLENPSIEKVGQNLKYDLTVLANYGVQLQGPLFDTMLAHYLLEPDARHNMDILAKNYLGYEPVSIEALIGKKGAKQGSMRDVPLEQIKEYAIEDADITWQLKILFAPKIQELNLQGLMQTVEAPLVPVLADMERSGVRIDTEALADISQELGQEIEAIEQRIYTLAGEQFNIASPKQLGDILFDKLKLDEKAKKTKTGQYATGEEILVKLDDKHPIIHEILEHRALVKLKNTYVDTLPTLVSPRDGRIHTSYNQAVAATGRLSSANPNLQNIPIRTDKGRQVRKAFVPASAEHILLAADYSQIELRIMAAFSQDQTMIEAFRQGRDIHATTAAKIFKVPLEEVSSDMRRKAKTANFGIIYGISAHGLSQRLNIPRKEAGEIITAYFEEFPAIKQYMDDVVNKARSQEYVETILGRRRYLRNINSRNAVERGFAERNAINAPIQGSAADLIKLAMIRIHEWMKPRKLRSKMILQVHDELVFDVHQAELDLLRPAIVEAMQQALPSFPVPLEVELGIGQNWLEAH